MPVYSRQSKEKLATCHPDLQRLFNEIIKHWDCKITYGKRTIEEQKELVRTGASKTMNSKHLPQDDGTAHAADVVPLPLDWKDTNRFYYFCGFVLGVATMMGIKVRLGCDWDGDMEIKDNNFNDLVHFELLGEKK